MSNKHSINEGRNQNHHSENSEWAQYGSPVLSGLGATAIVLGVGSINRAIKKITPHDTDVPEDFTSLSGRIIGCRARNVDTELKDSDSVFGAHIDTGKTEDGTLDISVKKQELQVHCGQEEAWHRPEGFLEEHVVPGSADFMLVLGGAIVLFRNRIGKFLKETLIGRTSSNGF